MTRKAYQRELQRIKVPEADWPDFPGCGVKQYADATTSCFETASGQLYCIVCIRKNKKPKHEIYGLLVHEATHVWQRIKEWLGEHNPSNEFEAYAMQNISQNLMAAYDS